MADLFSIPAIQRLRFIEDLYRAPKPSLHLLMFEDESFY
jgi:hypothetical protein